MQGHNSIILEFTDKVLVAIQVVATMEVVVIQVFMEEELAEYMEEELAEYMVDVVVVNKMSFD